MAVVEVVPLEHLGQRVEAFDRRIGAFREAIALIDLMHRQPGLDVLLRLVVKDVLTAVGAGVVLLAVVLGLAVADRRRIVRFGEQHRDLANLAQHGQGIGIEAVALLGLVAPVGETRPVVLVEGVRVLGRQPVNFLVVRHPGVEGRRTAVLVEGRPRLMADVLLVDRALFQALGHGDAVTRQIGEQGATVLLEIDLPGFFPAHHALRQHVVHHHRDQGQHAHATPRPLVDPLLHDRQVVRVLLEHELDALEAQRHVPRFVGLRREAEGHRRHVAVVGGA